MKYLMFLVLSLLVLNANAKEFEEAVTTVKESTIYFDQDKTKVSGDGEKKLQKLSDGEVTIVGYASSEGSDSYNMDLAKRRANIVSGILSRPSHVSWVGENEADPLMDYRDRKVVIRVTDMIVVYNPVFGGYDLLYGPVSHIQYRTIPTN